MKVRFETTADGDVAILPRAEYERLVALAAEAEEDAGTARLVARARKDAAAGAPLLPLSVAEALADGENPIRALRAFRGLTQVGLAAAVGIAQGYLSDLESGKRKGPIELHRKMAHALDVPLDLLAPAPAAADKPAVLRGRKSADPTKQQRSRR